MRLNSHAVASAALASALICTVGLAGCGSKSGTATPSPAAPASTEKPSPLPADPTFEGTPAGAAADVKITSCPTESGQQEAKATVTNSSKDKRDYAVMIVWMKTDSGTPLGSGLVLVHGLEPGQSKDISVSGNVVGKPEKCVLNVHAGQLKG